MVTLERPGEPLGAKGRGEWACIHALARGGPGDTGERGQLGGMFFPIQVPAFVGVPHSLIGTLVLTAARPRCFHRVVMFSRPPTATSPPVIAPRGRGRV